MSFPPNQFGVEQPPLPMGPEPMPPGVAEMMDQSALPPPSPYPPDQTDVPLIFEVADFPLTPEQEEELVEDTIRKVEQSYTERLPQEEEWKVWRLQAESRLSREDMADDWESDLDIPLTFERMQAINARIVNPIVQEDQVYVAKPRPEALDQNTQLAEQLNGYMDNLVDQWNVTEFCDDVLTMGNIYPYSVVKVPFVRETRLVRQTVAINGVIRLGQPQEVVVREGAFPEVCDPEDVCWYPLKSPSVNKTELIWHRVWMAPHEVKAQIRSGYFKDVLEDMTLTEKRPSDNAPANDPEKMQGLGEATHYEILEVYRAYDLKTEEENPETGEVTSLTENVEIIVWIDRTSKKLLRCVYNPFSDYTRPFFFWWWERRLNSLFGRSMCQRLEDLHRALSASFNQRLEAAAIANNNAWATDDDEFADAMEDRKPRPGGVFRIPSGLPKEHLMEMKLSQPYSQLPELEQNIERHADMSVGTSNYTFGIEQIQRPTATGQTKLMQEGQMPLFSKLKRFRDFLAEIMYAILARHQQMFPNGSRYWVRGPDGQLVSQVMEFPMEPLDLRVVIEIKASEAAWDKNAQKQDAVALIDRMKDSYSVLGGMVQAAAAPSPAAPAMLKMAIGYSQVLRNLLNVFEQPNIDQLVPDLQQEVLGGQFLFQQLQQLASQNAQLQAALNGPMGLPPGTNNGPNGPEGSGGPPQGGPLPGPGGAPPQ